MNRKLLVALFALAGSASAQIHLCSGSKQSYPNGRQLSGFAQALGAGSSFYDDLDTVTTSGVPAEIAVTHGGITCTVRHRDDDGTLDGTQNALTAISPNYFGVGSNSGFSTVQGSTSFRDMLVFSFSQPVAHWATVGSDLESVADEPAIVRAYDDTDKLIFERELILPLQEDGDVAPNFIGLISDRANLATVTISVGNSAANYPGNAPNWHQAAFLDLRFGDAALVDETRQELFAFNELTAEFDNVNRPPIANGTAAPHSMFSLQGTAEYTLSPGGLGARFHHRVGLIFQSSTATIGPNQLLFLLSSKQVETGSLAVSANTVGFGSAGMSWTVDVGADGTIDLTSGSANLEVTVDGTLPILVTLEQIEPTPTFAECDLNLDFVPFEKVYDNGPMITHAGEGRGGADASAIQTGPPFQHNMLAYSVSQSQGWWSAEEFTVCDDDMNVVEVELFAVEQIDDAANSTLTGAYVEFLDGPPNAGGVPLASSPLPTTNLMTAGSVVRNDWTGIYRTAGTNLTASNLPVFGVRVRLPNPLTLSPGTYWLRWALDGAPILGGPFTPALAVTGKRKTGNSLTRDPSGTWSANYHNSSSATDPAGLPFRFYGTHPGASALGDFLQTTASCNASHLDVEGSPIVGGFVHAELENPTPGSFSWIGLGLTQQFTPVCGCQVGHEFAVLTLGTEYELDFPIDSGLCGLSLYLQGLEFGVSTCPILPIELTNTIRVRIR